jgi:hypothetical protein
MSAQSGGGRFSKPSRPLRGGCSLVFKHVVFSKGTNEISPAFQRRAIFKMSRWDTPLSVVSKIEMRFSAVPDFLKTCWRAGGL